MSKQDHKITINVENVDVKRWNNGQLEKVGETLKVLSAHGTDGSNHSDQYQIAGKLMTFDQYVEMMKNRFKYGVVEIAVFEYRENTRGSLSRKKIRTYIA